MRYVFDIDDTICRHVNRDYANARPIAYVIECMRNIRNEQPDAQITLFTSRGMKSCNGDAAMAEAKNRPILEDWLQRHGVPYDEIIFGKPFADVYIDDKAVNSHTIEEYPSKVMRGFSGAKVFAVGDIVCKECENTTEQVGWYEYASGLKPSTFSVPKVYSSQFGKIFMQRVKARTDVPDIFIVDRVLDVLGEFRKMPAQIQGDNDMDKYCEYISDRGCKAGINTDELCKELMKNANMVEKATFCHGDLSMSNILPTVECMLGNVGLTLIDPSTKSFMWHWIVDAAKFRASLNGLDEILKGKEPADEEDGYNKPLRMFDIHFSQMERKVIELFEKSHYVRVAYYAYKLGKPEVAERIKSLYYGK